MLTFKDNKISFDLSRCQQCGACEAVCPKGAIAMERQADGTLRVAVDHGRCIRCKRCVAVCPANKREDCSSYFEGFEAKGYFLGWNADEGVRRECSSGGVAKTIVVESLRSGVADGVYTLRRTEDFPFAEGEFYTKDNIPAYGDMPNSVYHSVPVCRNIGKVGRCGRLVVVGTACQLRAMNVALRGKADEVIRVCIFCKQQKTLGSTRFIAKMMGAEIPENLKFSPRYRGTGWPGIVRVNDAKLPWNRAAALPFGRRLWTVGGCNVCGDPFGTNAGADITLMDPWKIRQENALGETLVVVHTEAGRRLLEALPGLRLEPKAFADVEAALDLTDVWRKQQLVPFFRGEGCSPAAAKAGRAEQRQRRFFVGLLEALPRMPMVFYRALCKLPDMRNKHLKR